jgi:hypothetical protein
MITIPHTIIIAIITITIITITIITTSIITISPNSPQIHPQSVSGSIR